MVWITTVLIVTVVATATLGLLEATLSWPPVLLTILGCTVALVGAVRLVLRVLARLRRAKSLRKVPALTPDELGQLTPKERLDVLHASRGAVVQRITAWGVVFGLVFTAGSLIYTARTLETAQQGQVTDRYTKAVEQLGSKSLDVRVGAIYALERLARDSPRDRQTIVDVLAAFVREHDPKPETKFPKTGPLPPTTDIAAALTVLTRNPPPEFGEDYGGSWLNLAEVRTPLAQLPDAKLLWADLHDADLRKADLSRANLFAARLDGADLRGADLGTYLRWADLAGADLRGANLYRADLRSADLAGADLRGANLREAEGLPDRGWLVKNTRTDSTTKF
ncbi:pentapeptide repeat-containing protein [Nonomuraea sp. JJY05]|uniref:pentapeptide repeat-containing protein n=1 Tax=Nonomuraea sp. JJY05 TaxID=3350255 RepID=UPI00373EDCE9